MHTNTKKHSSLLPKILPSITLLFILAMFIATLVILLKIPNTSHDYENIGFYAWSVDLVSSYVTFTPSNSAIILTVFSALAIISILTGYHFNKKNNNHKSNTFFLTIALTTTIALLILIIMGFVDKPQMDLSGPTPSEFFKSLIFKASDDLQTFTYNTVGMVLVIVGSLIGTVLIVTSVFYILKTFKK